MRFGPAGSAMSLPLQKTCTTQGNFVALVGRKDEPTDALRDYCRQLGSVGLSLETAELNWDREGRWNSLIDLYSRGRNWSGRWILIQYTALSWSKRGFPFRVLAVCWLLRRSGARCAFVFHDSRGFGGNRWIDKIRRTIQHWTMRQAYRLADRSVFTIPVKDVIWLPRNATKATFIPIGANIPEPAEVGLRQTQTTRTGTVAVFGITGGGALQSEIEDISKALRHASKNQSNLKLVAFGRNSLEAANLLQHSLQDTDVVVKASGVIPAEDVTKVLSCSDVQLFVRGPLTAMRGSAIAGVACGLPIVGYAGPETGFPITEAGVQLVPYRDTDALGVALDRVLSDDRLRHELRLKSLHAYANYFCWEKIAERYAAELANG